MYCVGASGVVLRGSGGCAELVSQHDEMRKHAVSLVHKCRQAESVNAALDRECSRMRTQRPELAGRVSHSPDLTCTVC